MLPLELSAEALSNLITRHLLCKTRGCCCMLTEGRTWMETCVAGSLLSSPLVLLLLLISFSFPLHPAAPVLWIRCWAGWPDRKCSPPPPVCLCKRRSRKREGKAIFNTGRLQKEKEWASVLAGKQLEHYWWRLLALWENVKPWSVWEKSALPHIIPCLALEETSVRYPPVHVVIIILREDEVDRAAMLCCLCPRTRSRLSPCMCEAVTLGLSHTVHSIWAVCLSWQGLVVTLFVTERLK